MGPSLSVTGVVFMVVVWTEFLTNQEIEILSMCEEDRSVVGRRAAMVPTSIAFTRDYNQGYGAASHQTFK